MRLQVAPQIALIFISLEVVTAFRLVLETQLCFYLQNAAFNGKVQNVLAKETSIMNTVCFVNIPTRN
jgi:hypothetical protein